MGQFMKIETSGAKSPIAIGKFTYGLKPVPFKTTHYWILKKILENISCVLTPFLCYRL